MKSSFIHTLRISLVLLFVSAFSYSQAEGINGDATKGEQLFTKNCTACHALDKKLVGPALKGVVSRLQQDQGLGREWFQKWIKDNVALRASGDKYANQIFEEFGKSEMQQFPNLSEQDIDDVLAYVENPPVKEEVKEVKAPVVASEDNASGATNQLLMVSFAVLVALLIWIAFKLNSLVKLTQQEEGISELDEEKIKSFADFYEKNQKLAYGILTIVSILALYGGWAMLFGLGVDKGYKPEQPIYFSHKIHAGINGIDCQLCHTGAKYGKVSGIPTLNTCMNCHRNISEYKGEYLESGKTREFYTGEIKKIYSHVGWNEETQSYSNPQKPIKWTRIHNMPDFVYFNHSQHVVVGEKAIMESHNKKHPEEPIDVVCKACHGKIDTMNVVQMANDFTMGWCIECHRTTKVDLSNGYNAEYFNKIHDKLKKYKGEDVEVTVDAIGGMECGKCHY
ncbi:MAG: c-type cytochrome [Flavobacteriales bacterium]|nr:c-type cytochrome [Flavobacteriales bacterium]